MDTYGFTHKGYDRKTVNAISSSPRALTADESGQIFTNTGASGPIVFNLPTISDADDIGVYYPFAKLADQTITINAAAGEYVGDSSASGSISNSTAGQTYAPITLVSVSASTWAILPGAVGSWTTT